MIPAGIAVLVLFFLFGRKALAWAIVIGAVVFGIAVFAAPKPYDCHDSPFIAEQCR